MLIFNVLVNPELETITVSFPLSEMYKSLQKCEEKSVTIKDAYPIPWDVQAIELAKHVMSLVDSQINPNNFYWDITSPDQFGSDNFFVGAISFCERISL